jgi:hypothetical protein
MAIGPGKVFLKLAHTGLASGFLEGYLEVCA